MRFEIFLHTLQVYRDKNDTFFIFSISLCCVRTRARVCVCVCVCVRKKEINHCAISRCSYDDLVIGLVIQLEN